MMGRINNLLSCLIPMVFFSSLAVISASTFISDGVFWDHSATGRSILQAKKSCPLNFESQNYTIITSKCKGPQYPPSVCCGAFKQFACPFAEELNDLTNDCASTMFSYINLYGKYPPGLFANECREGKDGLSCDAAAPPSQSADSSHAGFTQTNPSNLLILGGTFAGILLWIA